MNNPLRGDAVKKEPAVTVGMVTALAAAVLGLLVVLGLNIDTQKQAAIVVIVGALFPIVSALITRKHVTPVSKEEVN
jgi:hypothetical protein